jgi:hypothetical protein
MDQQKSRILFAAIGVVLLLFTALGIYMAWVQNRPLGVNEVWQLDFEKSLDGRTVTVKGDVLIDPLSDFKYNKIYIIDSETPVDFRTPEYGFWFGIGIDGASCVVDSLAKSATCEPFDPGLETTYLFKGTLHVEPVGKKDIMWLSDIDFEGSRCLIDGKWQPVQLGKFSITPIPPFTN